MEDKRVAVRASHTASALVLTLHDADDWILPDRYVVAPHPTKPACLTFHEVEGRAGRSLGRTRATDEGLFRSLQLPPQQDLVKFKGANLHLIQRTSGKIELDLSPVFTSTPSASAGDNTPPILTAPSQPPEMDIKSVVAALNRYLDRNPQCEVDLFYPSSHSNRARVRVIRVEA